MQSVKTSVVCFGETLWDILPTGAFAGGAPMNVAYHLKKLGADPILISKTGMDHYGEKLVGILSNNGVPTECIQVGSEHPTGLVYAKPNEQNDVVYDIVAPSAWDFIEWNKNVAGLVEKADYFIYGSLASRNAVSRNTLYQLLEIAKTKVLDINLRAPHIHRTGIEHLLKKADILKMNLAELELVANWFGRFENADDNIKSLQELFSIETVIVTMGSDGALISNQGSFHRHYGYTVKVADTIGSGDSFLAGFIHKTIAGASIQDATAFASALGSLIATYAGGCPRYHISEITKLLNSHQRNEITYQN